MSALSANFIDPLRCHLSIFPNAACWVFVGIRWERGAVAARDHLADGLLMGNLPPGRSKGLKVEWFWVLSPALLRAKTALEWEIS
jgi:hypothetical protein